MEDRDNAVFIDPEVEADYISDKLGLDRELVLNVLDAEMDYLDSLGLVSET